MSGPPSGFAFNIGGRSFRTVVVDRITDPDGRAMLCWDDDAGLLYIDRAVPANDRPAVVAQAVIERLTNRHPHNRRI